MQTIVVYFLYFCTEKIIYPSYLNIMVKQNSIKIFEEKKVRTKQIFRIIQSIPSPKAEPFKQWMAQVA